MFIIWCNDYITKPFDSKELLARIEVQLRNRSKNNIIENLKYRELELLNDNHTLLVCNKKVNLTKTEYAIIKTTTIKSYTSHNKK